MIEFDIKGHFSVKVYNLRFSYTFSQLISNYLLTVTEPLPNAEFSAMILGNFGSTSINTDLLEVNRFVFRSVF